jgi:hypothetical protein
MEGVIGVSSETTKDAVWHASMEGAAGPGRQGRASRDAPPWS